MIHHGVSYLDVSAPRSLPVSDRCVRNQTLESDALLTPAGRIKQAQQHHKIPVKSSCLYLHNTVKHEPVWFHHQREENETKQTKCEDKNHGFNKTKFTGEDTGRDQSSVKTNLRLHFLPDES